MNLVQLSWKNLINKPLNLTLSLVLFALGVGLISLLLMLNKQLQENFDKNLAHIDLVIGAKGSPLQLILSSMYHIDNPTGNMSLKEARPFLRPGHPLIKKAVPLSIGDSYKGYRIVGTTHDILDLYGGHIAVGQLWQRPLEVTAGAGVARALGLRVGDTFKSSHGLIMDDNLVHDDAHSLHIVGILAPTGTVLDQLLLTAPQTVWAVHEHDASESPDTHEHEHDHDHEHDHEHSADTTQTDLLQSLLEAPEDKEITSVLLQFKSRNFQALNMGRNINENTDLLAATPAIELNRLHLQMDLGTKALNILAWVIVFVSGLSVFISLYASLKDRKYELALMRVMGASPGKIFFLILLEGLILATLGYLAGTLVGHLGMEILAAFMRDSYRYSFTGLQFLSEEIYLFAGALAIGFFAALLPAIQAKNTDISETLSNG
ncbi:MAG: FtsX-like permease family protein [Bacteroidetes bacterium]|nr:MAG: FtsX-like permease family protein [Bacteroidota bacterium]